MNPPSDSCLASENSPAHSPSRPFFYQQSSPGVYTLRYKVPQRPKTSLTFEECYQRKPPPAPVFSPPFQRTRPDTLGVFQKQAMKQIKLPTAVISQRRPSPNANYHWPGATSPGYCAANRVATERDLAREPNKSTDSTRAFYGTARLPGKFGYLKNDQRPRLGRYQSFGPTHTMTKPYRSFPDHQAMGIMTPSTDPYLMASWRQQRAQVKNDLDAAHTQHRLRPRAESAMY